MATVFDIYKTLNSALPFGEAEKWDNSGILVESNQKVERILVALDATADVIKEAAKLNAQLIVTHHPVIFHPLKALSVNEPAVLALKEGIAVLSAHTNYDVSEMGADAHLSKLLSENIGFCCDGVLDITQIDPQPHGFGRIGCLKKGISSEDFAKNLKQLLNCDSLRFAPCSKPIYKIAFCCGAGGEYFEKAVSLGCDAFITSDVKHSTFIAANNSNTALFVPTHYQMEKPAMQNLATLLSQNFPDIDVSLSSQEKEPSAVI